MNYTDLQNRARDAAQEVNAKDVKEITPGRCFRLGELGASELCFAMLRLASRSI